MDEFTSVDGYRFLLRWFLYLEDTAAPDQEDQAGARFTLSNRPLLDSALDQLCELVYVGVRPLREVDVSSSPYYTPNSASSERFTDHNTDVDLVRNADAFLVLQKYFLKSKHASTRIKLLDCILGIYAANYRNYCLLQHLHTLVGFFMCLCVCVSMCMYL
jgi:hypothetical protein